MGLLSGIHKLCNSSRMVICGLISENVINVFDVTVDDVKASYHSLLRKYEHFEKIP
jgi:hypothetical protein